MIKSLRREPLWTIEAYVNVNAGQGSQQEPRGSDVHVKPFRITWQLGTAVVTQGVPGIDLCSSRSPELPIAICADYAYA